MLMHTYAHSSPITGSCLFSSFFYFTFSSLLPLPYFPSSLISPPLQLMSGKFQQTCCVWLPPACTTKFICQPTEMLCNMLNKPLAFSCWPAGHTGCWMRGYGLEFISCLCVCVCVCRGSCHANHINQDEEKVGVLCRVICRGQEFNIKTHLSSAWQNVSATERSIPCLKDYPPQVSFWFLCLCVC